MYIYDNNRIVRISKNGSTTKGFSEDELITANNWKKAAMHSITPRIFWQGYVNIDDKKKRDFPHFAVIMEAYDTNMKEFVEQNLHKPKGRQIVHDLVKKRHQGASIIVRWQENLMQFIDLKLDEVEVILLRKHIGYLQ